MRNIIAFLCLTAMQAGIIQTSLYSQKQHQFDLQAAQNMTGKNLRFGYQYCSSSKWTFSGGIKYHLNNTNALDSRGYVYVYRFHAEKLSEHIGLYHTVRRFIFKDKTAPHSLLYVFNTTDFNYMGYRSTHYFGSDSFNSNGNQVFYEYKLQHPAILTIESIIGIGFESKITNRLKFNAQLGLGLTYISEHSYMYINPAGFKTTIYNWPTIEYGRQLLAGFSYVFGDKME